MFFDDPPAAFASLVRWLVPSGRFTFAVWGHPAENPWMTSVREVAAEVIDVPQPDPEAPGLFRYAEADKLLTLLDRAGFGELDMADWRGALLIGGGLRAISPDGKLRDSPLLHVAQDRVESPVPGQRRPSSRSYNPQFPLLSRRG
jgi:SAM-dependent methyltransferase